MKILGATLILVSLFTWAAWQAQTGAVQADASSTTSAQDSDDQGHSKRLATAKQRACRALHWLSTD